MRDRNRGGQGQNLGKPDVAYADSIVKISCMRLQLQRSDTRSADIKASEALSEEGLVEDQ